MNSKNLFSSESAAADPKNQGRTRVKFAVFSVLAVHVAGLTALLLTQGCGPKTAPESLPQPELPAMDTNAPALSDTNLPPSMSTNLPPYGEAVQTNVPSIETPVAAAMAKYVVQSGDSFYSIAKAHGVSQRAVELANPGVSAKSLKPKQEINLPAPGTGTAPAATAVTAAVEASGATVYTVKSGDNLIKIASHFGTTPKAIKALNGLATDQIKVNQKLKIPAKPVAAPAPVVPTMPAPVEVPVTAPAPAATPAPVR